jgi:hypothetical protein
MARVTHNALLRGLSGKLGGLVIRQVGDQTIVSAAEAPGQRAPRSLKQQAHLDRMYRAQLYAKAQLRDPAARALYATGITARCTSAYTVAIADYMKAPVITCLKINGYHGQPGDKIQVLATDNFAVTAVHICIRHPNGALLEEGPATPAPDGSWCYTAAVRQVLRPGTSITATVYDRPGNATTQTALL